jgi:hypothetical protein
MLSFLLMAITMQTLLNGSPEKRGPVQKIHISPFRGEIDLKLPQQTSLGLLLAPQSQARDLTRIRKGCPSIGVRRAALNAKLSAQEDE